MNTLTQQVQTLAQQAGTREAERRQKAIDTLTELLERADSPQAGDAKKLTDILEQLHVDATVFGRAAELVGRARKLDAETPTAEQREASGEKLQTAVDGVTSAEDALREAEKTYHDVLARHRRIETLAGLNPQESFSLRRQARQLLGIETAPEREKPAPSVWRVFDRPPEDEQQQVQDIFKNDLEERRRQGAEWQRRQEAGLPDVTDVEAAIAEDPGAPGAEGDEQDLEKRMEQGRKWQASAMAGAQAVTAAGRVGQASVEVE